MGYGVAVPAKVPASEITDRIPRVPPRLPTLTSMRFLAALLVFVYHAATVFGYPSRESALDVNFVTGKLAFLGVCFFFVLSGFVLTWSARPDDPAGSFWRRRFFKIYPNHLVTFAVALALLVVLSKPITGLLPNLLLIQAWFPDPEIFNSANVVSWSLAVEAVFYLLFPLLYRWLARIPQATLWWCAGGVVLAMLCVPLLADAVLPASQGNPLQPGASLLEVWFLYMFPPVCLLQFLLGMLMARIVLTGRWIGVPLPFAVATLAGGYVLALYVPYNFGINATTIVPVALVITAGAVADSRGTRTFLRGPAAVWLGNVSFAFYLVHYLVLMQGRELLGNPTGGLGFEFALLTAAFALSLLLSWLLYAGVERPVMRRWSRPRRRSPRDTSVRGGNGHGGPVRVEPARPYRGADGPPRPPRAGLPPLPPRGVGVPEEPRPRERRW